MRRATLDIVAQVWENARITTLAVKRKAHTKRASILKPIMYMVGDLMLKKVTYSHTKDKFSPKWVGPNKVHRVVGKGAY